MAKLTTIGVYNYDPHLFDGLTFPAGIDKDIAVSQILTRSSEFEVLYPNPTFYAQMITFWGKKHYRTFEKWVEGLAIPFDPLYNYDRFEEFVDERIGANTKTGTESGSAKDNNARTTANIASEYSLKDGKLTALDVEQVDNGSGATTQTDGTRTNTNSESVNADGTSEQQKSAFDSSSYSPDTKTINDNTQTTAGVQNDVSATKTTTEGTSQTATGNTMQHLSTDAENISSDNRMVDTGATEHTDDRTSSEQGTSTERSKHTAHLYGNIGVTTSAALLQEFLDVERFNIYEQIADIFVDEFCIMIY